MFKLKYADLNNSELTQGLSELAKLPLGAKVAWNIGRLLKQIDHESKEGRELYSTKLKEFAELTDKGELMQVKDEKGNVRAPFKIRDDKKDEFDKFSKEFMDIEIEVKSHKIKISDLGNERVTPQTMGALGPVINELEVA